MKLVAVTTWIVCAGLGCGVHVTDGGSPLNQVADAPNGVADGGGGGGDAGGDGGITPIDAPPDSAALVRVVYLNFGPTKLVAAGSSDATQNFASWMQASPGTTKTAPAYHSGEASQGSDEETIVSGVTTALQGIATVVTTRPASGEYVMVEYGGTAGDVDSFYGIATNELDCGDLVPNDVAWIADALPLDQAVSTTLGAIGFGLGLTATATTTDCMCSWGNNCNQAPGVCQLDNGIARDQNVDKGPIGAGPAQETLLCPGSDQDEKTTFQTAFASGL